MKGSVLSRQWWSVVLLVAACGPSMGNRLVEPPTAAPRDEMVVPGGRIGPIALGMSAATLFNTLGTPDESNRFKDAQAIHYKSVGLRTTVLDSYQQVINVHTDEPRYATAEGIRVGASELEVRAKLGPPVSTSTFGEGELFRQMMCYGTGLQLILGANGKVLSMGVYPAAATGGPGSQC